MHRSGIGRAGIRVSLAAAVVCSAIVISTDAHAQAARRRGPPPGGGDAPGGAPPAAPSYPRMPYVGAWEGSVTLMRNGPGAGRPISVRFDIADSATMRYAGVTILPNDARAPHLNTAVSNGEMRWQQPNSGGGSWFYSARLVARDSIEGTVVLRDWPQLAPGAQPPSGTFVLVRRRAGASGGT